MINLHIKLDPLEELQRRGYKFRYNRNDLLLVLPKTITLKEMVYYREIAIMNDGKEAIYYMTVLGDVLFEKIFQANTPVLAYTKCAIYLFDQNIIDLQEIEEFEIDTKQESVNNPKVHTRECVYCGKAFNTIRKNTKTCSRSCGVMEGMRTKRKNGFKPSNNFNLTLQ